MGALVSYAFYKVFPIITIIYVTPLPMYKPVSRRRNLRPAPVQLDAPWVDYPSPASPTPLAYIPNRNTPPHWWPPGAYATNQLSTVYGFTIAPETPGLNCDECLTPLPKVPKYK